MFFTIITITSLFVVQFSKFKILQKAQNKQMLFFLKYREKNIRKVENVKKVEYCNNSNLLPIKIIYLSHCNQSHIMWGLISYHPIYIKHALWESEINRHQLSNINIYITNTMHVCHLVDKKCKILKNCFHHSYGLSNILNAVLYLSNGMEHLKTNGNQWVT